MKRRTILSILSILIVITSGILIYRTNDEDIDISANTYAFTTYDISLDNTTLINEVYSDNYLYMLYQSKGYYLVKEINILNREENTYSYITDGYCKLQNDTNTPYISCKDDTTISLYNTNFSLILNRSITNKYDYSLNLDNTYNTYISNNVTYPNVIDSICSDTCLLIRYNELTNLISLYNNNVLLEEYINNYGKFEYGFFTYQDNLINVYNIDNEYNEYSLSINLDNKIITISSNYLYVVNNNIIDVYNLSNSNLISSIDISKVKSNISYIKVYNSKLYIFSSNDLYIYDITSIEGISSTYAYASNEVNSLTQEYYSDYGVNVYVDDNLSSLNNSYTFTSISSYTDLIDALEDMQDYFDLFNKTFFNRFKEDNMKGLDIYLVDDINTTKDGYDNASVVGLYFKKNSKYVIVVDISSSDTLFNILAHETMHAIDDYLSDSTTGFNEWSSYNYEGFSYSHVYHVNAEYSDTLGNNSVSGVYFVDNYSRSSELEDRARLFEYICRGESLSNYPHLNAKINYIKKILITNFPEIYYKVEFNS